MLYFRNFSLSWENWTALLTYNKKRYGEKLFYNIWLSIQTSCYYWKTTKRVMRCRFNKTSVERTIISVFACLCIFISDNKRNEFIAAFHDGVQNIFHLPTHTYLNFQACTIWPITKFDIYCMLLTSFEYWPAYWKT